MKYPTLLSIRLLLCLLAVWVVVTADVSPPAHLPGCRPKCGDVDIPYPFGIGGDRCAIHGFDLDCTATNRTFLGSFEVTKISVEDAKVWVKMNISWRCYGYDSDTQHMQEYMLYQNFTGTPFSFSHEDNKIIVMGCNTLGYMTSIKYIIGCSSNCTGRGKPKNGSCSGAGCCQAEIPKDQVYLRAFFNEYYNTSKGCSYIILMEDKAFSYSTTYATSTTFWNDYKGQVPVVMDWTIGQRVACDVAMKNLSSYACVDENSLCVNSTNGGYRCNCSIGYTGNPYVKDGCKDVNECEHIPDPCATTGGTCQNTQGSFTCVCPRGKQMSTNHVCMHVATSSWVMPVIGASVGGVVLVVVAAVCALLVRERINLQKIRQNYFRGGLLLFKEITSQQGVAFKIFTEIELQEATDKFNEKRILGHGGHVTVYKGLLKGNVEVAVKRCMSINEQHMIEFGNEMLILSQINHKNIVKLLGCCLEVEVPILVYEFIPNGTLFHLIHRNEGMHISLATRLQIAYESAEALSYLHSWASPAIILHGDVKSSNILIGCDYTAKVSDFGASIIASTDEPQFVTLVQGTCGYLDPEYKQTCQLTDKSDVYSFGVVLLELLTGKKPFNLEGPEDEKSLALRFIFVMKEDKLEEILDNQIVHENIEVLIEIAELAKECLEMSGANRPSMREVSERLDRLRKVMQHPWATMAEMVCATGTSATGWSEPVAKYSSTGLYKKPVQI